MMSALLGMFTIPFPIRKKLFSVEFVGSRIQYSSSTAMKTVM